MLLGSSLSENSVSHNARVVIIEDDRAIRESLAMYLEIEGYEVISAANGKQGIELLRRIPKPGLILLDLMMPVMDGWQFMEIVENDSALASIPIVIVSAYSDRAHGIKSREMLKKPVDFDALIAVVKNYCGSPTPIKSGAA